MAASLSGGAAAASPGEGFRPEIQGLRALAVLAVLLFHVWPAALPGGYIGVDVFFVISGFLITGHLLREVRRTGRVSLSRFWARRIRRLLPASFLVLGASLLLLFAVLPETVRATTLRQIGASAVYLVNWVLAVDAVDYLAAENEATLVQHYWTLSVEEQFYLAWPVLIALALLPLVLRRRSTAALTAAARRRRTDRLVLGLLALVAIGSFAWSLWQTAADPAFAYFATPARAWEFAAGGLLAFLPESVAAWRGAVTPLRRLLRAALGWAGVAAIMLAAIVYGPATPFPGAAALLPVLGTVAVIAAGHQRERYAVSAWSPAAPVRLLGDWSYSIYLWHWPLIVAYPHLRGHAPGLLGGLAIIAASIALAALTKVLVEDPVRHAGFWTRRLVPAYALAAAGAIVLGLLPTVQAGQLTAAAEQRQLALSADQAAWELGQERIDAVIERVEAERAHAESVRHGCSGANAMLTPEEHCAARPGRSNALRPSVSALAADVGEGFVCYTQTPGARWAGCSYGPERAKLKVALIGDSHAAMLFSALKPKLRSMDWRLTVYLGRCVWAAYPAGDPCVNSLKDARRALDRGDYDLVITTGQWGKAVVQGAAGMQRLHRAWRPALEAGTRIVVLADNPELSRSAFRCLESSGGSFRRAAECSVARDRGLPAADPQLAAARALPGVAAVDLSDLYCTATRCPAAIGNIAVYRDTHHVTTSYWRSLLPHFRSRLKAALTAADAVEAVAAGGPSQPG